MDYSKELYRHQTWWLVFQCWSAALCQRRPLHPPQFQSHQRLWLLHWPVELRTSRKLGQKTQKISTNTKCSRLIKAIFDATVNTTYHLNQACPNCSTAGFCSNQSRAQKFDSWSSSEDWDQLIKWVMSGVLLFGWKETRQPLGPSLE